MADELTPPSYGDLLEALREATRLLSISEAENPAERDALRSIVKSLQGIVGAADAGAGAGFAWLLIRNISAQKVNARDHYFSAQLGLSPYDAGFLASLNARW